MKEPLLISLIAALLLAAVGVAQENTAVLTGTTTDASQAVVPGATVEIANENTGFRRTGRTNDYGLYYFSGIPIGVYEVTVRKDGFRTERIESLALLVGQTRTTNVRMLVAAQAQEIQITAAAASLDQSSAEIGAVLVKTQVAQLPLNGRSWISEMALVPGAIDMGGGTQKSIRFAGHGIDDNNYRFDGIDATGIVNQSQNVNVRLQTSTEAIAEFRVDSMLFTAETGGTIGGQVQAVSKSGTNDYHGSAFEYIRNNAVDARSPFDPSVLPPLRLNQFGASLGGPLKKNRTFFFAAYEGLRQSLGQTLIGFVPSDSFRLRALAASPAIVPLLAAYPAGTSAVSADVWRRTAQGKQTGNENSGMIRIDHRLSEATSIFGRFNMDRAYLLAPSGTLVDVIGTTSNPTNGAVQLFHIFSPEMTNQLELGVNRAYGLQETDGALSRVSNVGYSLTVAGFTTLNQTKAQVAAPTTYSLLDNWTWIQGQHTIKAGVEIKKVNFNYNVATSFNLNYASTNAFASNNLNEVNVVGGTPMVGDRKIMYFGYVQDEWRIRPNLTANIGLRYEFFNVFHEIHGRDLPFDIETCGGYCPIGSPFLFPPTRNLEPRIAIAWSPARFHGKTVIRAGWGMYQGEGQLGDTKSPSDNYTQQGYTLSSVQFPSLSYPAATSLPANASVPATPRALQRNIANPTVLQWGLQIQTELPAGFVLDSGYVGNKGYHQFVRSTVNVINPLTKQRPLANFGQIDAKLYVGNETFHAWQTSLRRQLSRGWLMAANYMWSHSINDGSGGGGDANYPQNVACLSCEKASSLQDIRQSFAMDTVYRLPFGRGQRYLNAGRFTNALLGDWQFSAIAGARTGDAVNIVVSRAEATIPDGNALAQGITVVTRPNLNPGVSLTPAGGSTIQNWINRLAFSAPANGTFGNLGRNIMRGPNHWQADVALVKKFPINERFSLDFRAEAFNLFNHPQLGDPNSNFSSPSFGSITTTVNNSATGNGTPRRCEFSFRLNY
jgi:Carboxypeptidase regulatory-like domain